MAARQWHVASLTCDSQDSQYREQSARLSSNRTKAARRRTKRNRLFDSSYLDNLLSSKLKAPRMPKRLMTGSCQVEHRVSKLLSPKRQYLASSREERR